MTTGLQLYLDLCVFLFGAAIGSFLNVCIYRMPIGKSIVSPPSSCPSCGKAIRWFDNIPLMSYLKLRGRCRHCGAQFTARYFLVELLTALMFLTIWVMFGGWLAAIYWVFVAGLIVATFTDLEHYIIPDSISVGGVFVGFVLSVAYPALQHETFFMLRGVRSVIGILVGSAIVLWVAILGELVFKKEAMGFGDVKLMGAIGAFLGWQATVFTMVAASVVGSISGLLWILLSHERRAMLRTSKEDHKYHSLDSWSIRDEMDTHVMGSSIPYGPFLVLGAVLWIFVGNHVQHWLDTALQLGNN